MTKGAIFPPLLSQLHRGLLQIPGMLLQLALEALEKRDSVSSGARESSDDFVVVQAARFARGVFHHVIAHCHLTIGDEDGFVIFAHEEHSGAVHRRALMSRLHPAIIPQRCCEAGTRRLNSCESTKKGPAWRAGPVLWKVSVNSARTWS